MSAARATWRWRGRLSTASASSGRAPSKRRSRVSWRCAAALSSFSRPAIRFTSASASNWRRSSPQKSSSACRSPRRSASPRRNWAGRCRTSRTVSLHGRALASVVRHLQPGARVLALSWDGSTPGKLAQLLRDRGLGDTRMTILENMGGAGRARAAHDGQGGGRRRRRCAQHHRARGRRGCRQPHLDAGAGPQRRIVRERRPAHQARGARHHHRRAGAAPRRVAVGHRPRRRLDRHRMAAVRPVAARHRHRGERCTRRHSRAQRRRARNAGVADRARPRAGSAAGPPRARRGIHRRRAGRRRARCRMGAH